MKYLLTISPNLYWDPTGYFERSRCMKKIKFFYIQKLHIIIDFTNRNQSRSFTMVLQLAAFLIVTNAALNNGLHFFPTAAILNMPESDTKSEFILTSFQVVCGVFVKSITHIFCQVISFGQIISHFSAHNRSSTKTRRSPLNETEKYTYIKDVT